MTAAADLRVRIKLDVSGFAEAMDRLGVAAQAVSMSMRRLGTAVRPPTKAQRRAERRRLLALLRDQRRPS